MSRLTDGHEKGFRFFADVCTFSCIIVDSYGMFADNRWCEHIERPTNGGSRRKDGFRPMIKVDFFAALLSKGQRGLMSFGSRKEEGNTALDAGITLLVAIRMSNSVQQ